jgi:predicted kinase
MELNIHEKFNATLKEMMARKAPKDEIQKLIDDYRAQKDATVKSPESKTEVKKDDFVSSIPGLKEKLVKTQETKTPEVSVSSPEKTTATKGEYKEFTPTEFSLSPDFFKEGQSVPQKKKESIEFDTAGGKVFVKNPNESGVQSFAIDDRPIYYGDDDFNNYKRKNNKWYKDINGKETEVIPKGDRSDGKGDSILGDLNHSLRVGPINAKDPATFEGKDAEVVRDAIMTSSLYPGAVVHMDKNTNGIIVELPNGDRINWGGHNNGIYISEQFDKVNSFYEKNTDNKNVLGSMNFSTIKQLENSWGTLGYKFESNSSFRKTNSGLVWSEGADVYDSKGNLLIEEGTLAEIKAYFIKNHKKDDITKLNEKADAQFAREIQENNERKKEIEEELHQKATNEYHGDLSSGKESKFGKDVMSLINSSELRFNTKEDAKQWINYGITMASPTEKYNGVYKWIDDSIEALLENDGSEDKFAIDKELRTKEIENLKKLKLEIQNAYKAGTNEVKTEIVNETFSTEMDKKYRDKTSEETMLLKIAAEKAVREGYFDSEANEMIGGDVQKEGIDAKVEFLNKSWEEQSTRLGESLQLLANEAASEGIHVEYDGDNFKVTGDDIVKVNDYKKRFSLLNENSNLIVKDYEKTLEGIKLDYDEWGRYREGVLSVEKLGIIEHDLAAINLRKFDDGWRSLKYSIQSIFDPEGAADNTAAMQAGKQVGYEKDIDYRTAAQTGQIWRYASGEISTQGSNTVLALASGGTFAAAGLSAYGTAAAIGYGVFGPHVALQKGISIDLDIRAGEEAQKRLIELEKNKHLYTESDYMKTRAVLEEAIAYGDISVNEKAAAMFSTWLAEGTISSVIGTVPNALNAIKLFSNPAANVGSNLLRSNLKAASDVAFISVKGVLGEAIEETSIEAIDILSDYMILGRDADFSSLDDVAVASIMSSGPMTTVPNIYAAIIQQAATSEYRAEINKAKSNMEDIKKKLLKLKPKDTALRKLYVAEFEEEVRSMVGAHTRLEVDAIAMDNKDLKKLLNLATTENYMNAQAGVTNRDNSETIELKRKVYKESLSKEDAKDYQDALDSIKKQRDKATENLDYEKAGKHMFGHRGEYWDRKLKDDKDYKKANKREKLAIILGKIRDQKIKSNIKRAKSNDWIVKEVEKSTADITDPKKRKAAQDARYEDWANNLLARQTDALVMAREGNLSATSLLKEDQLKNLSITQAKNENEIIDAVYSNEDISDDEKQGIVLALTSGDAKAVILGSQYIVLSKKNALENLKNGDLLQGTVLSHEISHFIDDASFKDNVEKAKYTHLFHSLISKNTKELHDKVISHVNNVTDATGKLLYQEGKSFEKQDIVYKDEYTKRAQDFLMDTRNWSKELGTIRKLSGLGLRNKLGGTRLGDFLNVDQDFRIETEANAGAWMMEYIDAFRRGELSSIAKRKMKAAEAGKKAGGTKFSKFSALESINNLIPSDVKTKEDYQEFVQDRKRFAPLGKALEENGVISNYVKSKSVGDEYIDAMESVTDRVIGLRGIFNPERLRKDGTKVGKEAFGEFIFANTNFAKRDAKKALAIRKIESDKTTSIDTKEVREIEDQSTINESTSGRSDSDTKKTNVLNFTGVSSKINELMDVVDIMPVGSNTFKTVDEYTGKAAEIIFDIPAEKATKGNKNLSHKTKVVNGMMELSQAGKIQDFFRVGDNLEKLVKIMVPENVTSKTADISEVGENIDVARDIYGRSIGLKGKVLEYFFDKTGKRSQGLTTQPNVWELKPEFKNPSKETLDKLRSDLGITPQGQANVSDRAFNGQLLKGVAEYQAYQTALSITQRKLDAIKQEATTKEEKSAISQDIANVTAAQSRLAFSKSLAGKIYNDSQIKHGSLSGRVFGVIGTTKITYASAKRNPDGTIRWKTKSVRDLFGWWSDNETGEQARNRVANNFLSANPQYRDILRNTMSGGETISLFKTKDKFDSAINSTNVEQSTINRFHYNKKKLLTKSALEKIRTKEFKANELAKTVVGKQFWLAVQSHLKNNPDDVWFFEEMLVDSQNNQGAITRIIALFTSYPVDKKGQPVFNREVIEEHSSPQIKMARISLAAAKDGNIDDVWPVIEASYMQMSLLASDDAKVRAAGLSSNLPDIFWKEIVPRILDGSLNWLPKGYASFSRYAVAGVDLNGYELLSGETVTEFFGVSDIKHIDGSHNIKLQNDIILGILTGKFQLGYGQSIANVNLSKENSSNAINSSAVSFSRTANPAKGISVLDFDDTLATTKSGVRYTLPNPDHSPRPKKKVIFMAGGPGSGKSNVINQLGLKEQGFKVVNQDISLEWLMKNHGMPTDMREFTPEQASEFGKLSAQAREIALKKRIKYQGEGDGVIIDGTGASLNVMKKNIQDFKDKGYDVQMIFVETSQETALSRNKARKERSLRTGIVIKTHDSVQANKEAYKELFGERFAEVNTDNLKQGDAMPDDLSIKVNDFTSGYIKGRLNAGEYAIKGEELKQQGAEFDFSEFNQVVEGKTAPLFNKAMKLQEKFTSKDMFVLTARPAESNQAIFEFLQANGLNIPIENIVGLGSSLSSDKALWMAGKVGEGYNDFYFADDILENVQAVSDMLEQFDVKSKVQQAKRDFVLGDPKVKKLLDEKSMNDVKDVDGLANPGVYSNVKFSKSHRAEYENTVAKNRPDLSGKEVTATIDKMFEYIDGLDVPNKRKYEQITTKWLATSNIKLPEDSYKIQQAVEIAELKKEDIFSYKNPNEIIEKYAGTIKFKPISPVGIKEFTRATGINDPITTEYGIVEYEVEETREAQQKVRDIVNTHWGPNSNPWCITKIDKDGNLSEDAWRDWTSYGKGPKRIVFQNGKLLAMKANYEYWGKMNKHSEGPIIQIKEGNVTNTTELVVGDGGIVNPIIRETRTVSKDGNTVTTNIFEDSQDGYADGTTIVENRIKGVKTKETRFDPDGSKVSTQEFNKKGKPTTSYQFNPNGKVKSVNGHLQQQAITEAGLDVNAMEDADIDLTNELVVRVGDIIENNYTETENDGTTTDYFYGRALVGDQVMEIGFESKTGLDLADVTKTIDGKTRLDIGKVIREVDPNVKGLPKTGVKFSKGISKEFNDIIEQSTGVGSEKVFSDAQAKIRGNKMRFDNIVPYSVQDLMGLLYNFVGKGKVGEQHMEFFKKALIDPFARAINELNQSKQSSAGDYRNLTKAFPNVKKKLNKEVESGDYTYDQAIRVYLWNKAGFEVPGLSKRDLNTLDSIVKNDPELQAFADTLGLISKKEEGYAKPGEHWLVENIASDLLSDGSIGDARSEFLAEWQQNADEMFSKENLNKIQAIYGNKFREALEDILYRMKYGTNRPTGSSRLTNNFMNWINNSTGAIMFFNMRSALLQTLSTTNYINWTDNNPLKAAMAFADQKQYWSDFSALFNSDFLKQRRSGNQRSINEAELTTAVANSDNKAKAALAWLLQKGFLPTQIMDSFAISAGGATFYRNRINKYIKEGMTKEEAQEKAFLDFQEITEATQQSARPDMISQQQASPLGRLILSFQNTPMQYARIMNKAARDIVNGRGDQKSNISKIVYYGALQSIIFAALQSAIFASLGDDEEEEFDKKKQRIVGSMVDGWLAGLGVAGKAIGTIERSIKEYLKQKERGFNADHAQTIIQLLGFSPPIGSKLRKIYSAIQTEEFNKGVSEKRGFTLDNPTWSSWGNVIEGFTNIPLGRISNKLLNIDNALDSQNQWWERAALLLGWNTWDLGIKDPDIIAVKGEIKEERKVEKKEEALIKKEEKKKEVEEENISKEKANIELQKKEIEDGNKSPDCAAINKRGERCGTKIEKGSTYCTVHTKVEQSDGGKKTQCGKTKKDGKRCKMQTSNKSGYCYYHD